MNSGPGQSRESSRRSGKAKDKVQPNLRSRFIPAIRTLLAGGCKAKSGPRSVDRLACPSKEKIGRSGGQVCRLEGSCQFW
ncbi:MAG TPA: hypothetical protein PK955_10170, partial [Methanoregulaceae archaeon]|nr:hypothetical protein [Methanoregulaceae archaeon]